MPAALDLACTDVTELRWAEGERERWAARAAVADHGRFAPDWPDLAADATTGTSPTPWQAVWLFLRGPADLTIPRLAHWVPAQHAGSGWSAAGHGPGSSTRCPVAARWSRR